MSEEIVLVVSVEELLRIGDRHILPSEQVVFDKPISRNVYMGEPGPPFARYVRDLFQNSHWMPRVDAEKDARFRQLIPYITLQDARTNRVLAYRRPSKGLGDARIQGNRSVGFGGHVNPSDEPLSAKGTNGAGTRHQTIQNAMRREMHEELGWMKMDVRETVPSPVLHGTICLHGTDVDRVHLGLRYVMTLPRALEFPVDPTEVLDARWCEIDEVLADPTLESWSRHALTTMQTLDARMHELHMT